MTVKCSLLLREANKFPSTIFENKVVRKIMMQIKFVADAMDEHIITYIAVVFIG
jgi:hypothetical protein